jgi:hypothetical protein
MPEEVMMISGDELTPKCNASPLNEPQIHMHVHAVFNYEYKMAYLYKV